MTAGWKLFWFMLALLLFGVLLIKGIDDPKPVLMVQRIDVTNMCFLGFIPRPDWDTNGTGSGQVVTNLYTGPAMILSAPNLSSGMMLVQCSHDFQNWFPFPQAGFQVVLWPSNPITIVAIDEPLSFFRGVWQP